MTSLYSASDPWAFVGRAAELSALAESADEAAQGTPCLVIVEGETGIGKTALVREAVAALDGFTVWWASCDADEQDLPFGVVDQWLRQVGPALTVPDRGLPRTPARDASPLEVGTDLIELIGAAEAQGPLALVVDDILSADAESLRVLGFVLRRLWADRVLVLVTAGTDSRAKALNPAAAEALDRLPSAARKATVLRLPELTIADVNLLADVRGVPSTADTARRLWEHTGGHPLYLRSVLTGGGARDLADPTFPLPLPDSLSAAVRQVLLRLPPDSRLLVDALAVLDAEAPLAFVGQLAELGDASAALGPAIDSGLVGWRPSDPSSPIRIQHRLQRDAVYSAIEPSRRRALHLAVIPLVDRESSWRHRVSAADNVDPGLAAELEDEAARVTASGRIAHAAVLLQWAAELSDSRAEYERRLLETVARYQYRLAYDTRRSAALRAEVEQCAPSPLRSYVQARYCHFAAKFGQAEEHYLQALEAVGPDGDPALADRIRLGLGQMYAWQMRRAPARDLLNEVLDRALLDSRALQEARFYLACIVMEIDGPARTLESMPALMRLPADPRLVGTGDGPQLLARGLLRGLAGRLRAGIDDMSRQLESSPVSELRLNSACMTLPFLLYLVGDWERAAVLTEQLLAQAVVDDYVLGLTPCHAVAAAVAAGHGHWDEAEQHAQTATALAASISPDFDLLFACLATAVCAQARADGPGMLNALRPVLHQLDSDIRPAWRIAWLPLLAEAHVYAGTLAQARQSCAALRELAESMPCLGPISAWACGQLAEREGDPVAALEAYRLGIALGDTPDDIPLHRARLEHAYGALLLARGDHRRAFEALRVAHQRYSALGAAPFAARTAAGLASCNGSRASEPTAATGFTGLTEREQLVARLAAQGLTNHEIAKKLFLSVKTVEYHLGHVYQKLGLASRRQLRTVS
ncbi:helix-turn-helix transcriptional regulator [Streptacidiphilus rugosus]|uniref:helix-turn-helix transcriptional regulator n=1 Tax=Streptacidiphilus rugosus TaxID=405783 RepID=UPI0012F7D9DB|nr:LuxR family transcriptional regulator [Streptacidiphilus rugosus]